MPKIDAIDGEIYGHLAVMKLGQILAFDCTVGNAAKRTFNIIAGFAGQDGQCWPSITKVAETMRVSRPAVTKQVNILVEHGYLTKTARYDEKHGGRKTNLFTFNIELAQNYHTIPDIFSKKNVTLMVTYLVTLLSYRGMKPNELSLVETSRGDIKRTKKKTHLKKQNKKMPSKCSSRADDWDHENDVREKLAIPHEKDKKLKKLYRQLKDIVGIQSVVVFDLEAKKALRSSDPKDKINELISLYESEVNKRLIRLK